MYDATIVWFSAEAARCQTVALLNFPSPFLGEMRHIRIEIARPPSTARYGTQIMDHRRVEI